MRVVELNDLDLSYAPPLSSPLIRSKLGIKHSARTALQVLSSRLTQRDDAPVPRLEGSNAEPPPKAKGHCREDGHRDVPVSGKIDGGDPPSILEWAKVNELLERYTSVELYLSPSDRGAGDDGCLAGSDCIVSWLAKAGMVEHVPGIGTNLHLHATVRPDIERLAE